MAFSYNMRRFKNTDVGSKLPPFKKIKSVSFIINLLEINLCEIKDELIFQSP